MKSKSQIDNQTGTIQSAIKKKKLEEIECVTMHELKFRQLTVFGFYFFFRLTVGLTSTFIAECVCDNADVKMVQKFPIINIPSENRIAIDTLMEWTNQKRGKKTAKNRVRSGKSFSGHSSGRKQVVNNFYYFFLKWCFFCNVTWVFFSAFGFGWCPTFDSLLLLNRRTLCASSRVKVGAALKPQCNLIALRQLDVIQSSANESYFMRLPNTLLDRNISIIWHVQDQLLRSQLINK